jgi:ABC-2 type transport system ATP-binding protein
MPDQAIAISHVHKAYGSLQVLKGVDLEVPRGEIFGLLGPNGAGKTTLTHIILGLLRPDDGAVRVFGEDDRERISRRIGYLPERPRYHQNFTGREYLVTLGRLSDLGGRALFERVDEVLELVGLGKAAERRVGTYSKGMLQRVGIAQAVLHRPDLLIVDEPASGLDPGGQREMAALLQALGETGHTIFLCTHQLSEVARLCDRVGVLTHGRIRHTARLDDLRARGRSVTVQVAELPLATAESLQRIRPEVQCERESITIFPASDRLINDVLRLLLDDGVPVRAVVPDADALEQFYLAAVHGDDSGAPQSPPEQPEALLETLIEDR